MCASFFLLNGVEAVDVLRMFTQMSVCHNDIVLLRLLVQWRNNTITARIR